ncbi:hypothetical protein H0O03_03775 [Candidatus Micrarchaeota archaeon]|nr:hypothetical protein [Candidatus Micrarchaeota archaeon]
MKKRGFIGPLGDDIPSIFPIVLGIVIFMGTIVYANGAYNARNADLHLRKTALELSYMATEKGTLSTQDFRDLCDKSFKPYASHAGTNFAIVFKRHCSKIDLFNKNPFYSNYSGNAGLCTNAAFKSPLINSTPSMTPDVGTAIADEVKDAVVLNYPIAVNCPEENSATLGLGVINVIVWQK